MTLCLPPNHHFTALGTPQVEAKLRQALEALSGKLRGTLNATVILGGGYGRGEGGVFVDDEGEAHLYNDLDFFVFIDDGISPKECYALDQKLRLIGEELGEKLGIDGDFAPARKVNSLPAVANTLMFQELRRGYVTIHAGNDASVRWLDYLPAIESNDVPQIEGLRLLLNRGMGLYLAGKEIAAGNAASPFVIRNLNKAVLGAGDGLLLCKGQYCWGTQQRQESLQKLCEQDGGFPLLNQEYRLACQQKIAPRHALGLGNAERWQQVRKLWFLALCRSLGVEDASLIPQALRRLTSEQLFGQNRDHLRTCGLWHSLRWLRRMGLTTTPGSLGMPPLVRALSGLASQIPTSPGVMPPEQEAPLLKSWRAFN